MSKLRPISIGHAEGKELFLSPAVRRTHLHIVAPPGGGKTRILEYMIHQDIEVTPQLPLNAELAHFVECVNTGATPLVSGEDGLVAVSVSEIVKQKIHASQN